MALLYHHKLQKTKGDYSMSGVLTRNSQNDPDEMERIHADKVSDSLGRDFVEICFVLLALGALCAAAMFWILAD